MYDVQADVYRALGDGVRLRILALLRVREACVCELVSRLPVSQPAVSQHLGKLKRAGLVRERRQSYWTYYALRDDLPAHLAAVIASLPHDPDDEAWLMSSRVDAVCGLAGAPAPRGGQDGRRSEPATPRREGP